MRRAAPVTDGLGQLRIQLVIHVHREGSTYRFPTQEKPPAKRRSMRVLCEMTPEAASQDPKPAELGTTKKAQIWASLQDLLVGARGFEPPTPRSRTKR